MGDEPKEGQVPFWPFWGIVEEETLRHFECGGGKVHALKA